MTCARRNDIMKAVGFQNTKKGVLPMARYDFRQKPFRLYGVPFFDSTGKLERVPEDVAKQCNDGVVTLSKRCPGARLRFCTDSRKISFRSLKGASGTWIL